MERGTPQWVLNTFRRVCLAGFLRDLRALEACGLNPELCLQIQGYLGNISKALQEIPVARPPGKSVGVDFKEFADLYIEWNNKDGCDPETRRIRSRAYDSLERKRQRLADRIKDSLPKLDSDDITWGTIDRLVDTLNELSIDRTLEGNFKSLRMSLREFNSKLQKYKMP